MVTLSVRRKCGQMQSVHRKPFWDAFSALYSYARVGDGVQGQSDVLRAAFSYAATCQKGETYGGT